MWPRDSLCVELRRQENAPTPGPNNFAATSCHMILLGAPEYSPDVNPTKSHTSLGRIQMGTATRSFHPTWLQHKTGLKVHSRRSWSITLSGNILLSTCQETQKTIKCSMGMDILPAQIFTYRRQHPPMSRTVVLSLNAHSSAKELREAHEHEPETADAFKADRNVEASEFGDLQRCSCCSEKKVDTVVLPVSTCRSLKKTSKQQVFVHTKGDIDNMLNLGDIPTANTRVHNKILGTSHQRCEQLGWGVEDK